MKEEYYHLTYWGWDNESYCSKLCVKVVLVPKSTMDALTALEVKTVKALKFIVDDGQDFILNKDNFYSLERVFFK